jgi:imidazolonepropionase-like amidohydrolase
MNRMMVARIAAVLAIAALASVPGAGAQQGTPTRGPLEGGLLAIANVSLVPMTRDTVIVDGAVLVRDGRFAWAGGRADLRAPRGARVIDGQGGFLMPGLADMHTHLFADGEAVPDTVGAAELGVMLANGVTVARLMIGTPPQLALRTAVTRGTVTGPQLWVASPQLTGRAAENAVVVTTAAEARAAVRAAARDGYDFVKLTLFVDVPVFEAVVDEARQAGIRVVGHVEPAVGIARALGAGMQLEHLDSFLEEALADSAPMRTSVTQGGVFAMRNWPSLDHMDDAKADRLAGAAARARVFLGPTQNVFNTAFAIGEDTATIRARADFAHWPPPLRAGYLRAHARYWASGNDSLKTPARRARYVAVRDRIIKAFNDSGGKLLTGSDTPEWFHTYGYGLHRELQAFASAGLSPYEALRAATVNAAEYLGARNDWGTIEVGRRADFVLVRANPLADVRNTAGITAVVMGGRWHDRATLDAMLARGRAATGGAPAAVP